MSVIDAAGAIRASSEPSRYPLNLRISVPFYPHAFFITLIAGKERRGAERLRQSVADIPFPVNHAGSPLTVTVSIGITSIERPDDTSDTVLKRADQALYRAKRDGRNRVVAEAA